MTRSKQHSPRRLARRAVARFAPLLTLSLLFVLGMSLVAQAQTFTILHNFTGGSDGYYPTAGLTWKGSGNLFGGAGPDAVFRFSRAGTGGCRTEPIRTRASPSTAKETSTAPPERWQPVRLQRRWLRRGMGDYAVSNSVSAAFPRTPAFSSASSAKTCRRT